MRRKSFFLEQGLSLAWAIATIAMVGSLYFSEVLRYVPCNLCWYARILMYPLVVLLGIAAVRKDYGIVKYVLPLTIIGIISTTYQYLMQKTDWVESNSKVCGIIPCDVEYINWLGFITIPFLALTAFILITIIMIGIHRANR